MTQTLERPAPTETPLRLNLGAGSSDLPGFTPVDRKSGGEVFPLAYPDESADEIYASHVLEHLPHVSTLAALADWVRVLKPGGLLRVAVPDFDYIVNQYVYWRHNGGWERDAGEEAIPPIEGWLMGGQTHEDDFHAAVFTRPALEAAFEAVGLVAIGPWVSEVRDCAALPVSLNVQGRKPGGDGETLSSENGQRVSAENGQRVSAAAAYHPPVTFPEPVAEPDLTFAPGAVRAVMTAPRLAPTNHFYCAQKTFGPLGIQMEVGFGVFWHASLARLFEQNLDAEFLIVLDYDTLFERADLEQLLLLMRRYPDADAICPLQARREDPKSPLFTVDVGDFHPTRPRDITLQASDLAKDLFPVATAHFGLTAIRTSAIRKVPRPWFHAQPGPDGRWDDGRIDADVAWWLAFREAGCSLYLAPRLVVGHAEWVVSWPGRDLKPRHQWMSVYDKEGKPDWAWR